MQTITNCINTCSMAIFQDSTEWILLQMMDVVVTTGAVRQAKFQ